jgi:hypothetical protein
MNEYRKRIAALKVGDLVVARPKVGSQWRYAKVTAIGERVDAERGYLTGPFIEADGIAFNAYGSALLEGGKTAGSRCIVPFDMWQADEWKPGAIPTKPKETQPCIECGGVKVSVFSPRCTSCRKAHSDKKKVEYKQNRQERDARYLRWQTELLP